MLAARCQHKQNGSIFSMFWLSALLFFGTLSLVQCGLFSTPRLGLKVDKTKKFSDEITSSFEIDSDLYSRQLFVYGESVQKRLMRGHVLVLGSSALYNEVLKNLALAGVGKLTLLKNKQCKCHPQSLLGNASKAIDYVKDLNLQVEVAELQMEDDHSIDRTQFEKHNFSTVVVLDASFAALMKLDLLCRQTGTRLVAANVFGASGLVFNDFLARFTVSDADGEIYREIPLQSGAQRHTDTNDDTASPSKLLSVSCIEEESHNLEAGDKVEVSLPSSAAGDGSCTASDGYTIAAVVQEITDRKSCVLSVSDEHVAARLLRAIGTGRAAIKKVKRPVVVHHKTLASQLLSPSFNPSNACAAPKKDRMHNLSLLACMKVLQHLRHSHNYNDSGSNNRSDGDNDGVCMHIDKEVFAGLVAEEVRAMTDSLGDASLPSQATRNEIVGTIYRQFIDSAVSNNSSYSDSSAAATVSVVGALASQEVIKSLTHLHVPVSQIQLFESLDTALVCTEPGFNDTSAITSEDVKRELSSLKVFVVGAGAIGCELLKNFALMGVGTGNHTASFQASRTNDSNSGLWASTGLAAGGVLVADMDHIERSNLNRQLLFRCDMRHLKSRHIGQSKSLVAAQFVASINPRMRVHGVASKLGPETEQLFDSRFWREADVVVTALDNVEARQYVDAQCVRHGKWLVDSGTLGTKGNTQVVIPGVSESYSSAADPPDEAIALCTIKTFPYQPEHCVAWAKNTFQQLFSTDVTNLKKLAELLLLRNGVQSSENCDVNEDVRVFLSSLSTLDSARLLSLFRLVTMLPSTSEEERSDLATLWAKNLFDELFAVEIQKVLAEHPADQLDEDGLPFWGGSRRLPAPLRFDVSDSLVVDFVNTASEMLRKFVLGSQRTQTYHLLDESLPLFDVGGSFEEGTSENASDALSSLHAVLDTLPKHQLAESLRNVVEHLQPQEFDKEQTLGHVAFVAAAANLRARVFSIRETSRLEVQRIAGNIIPALATTTALVAGLVSLEVIKIATERILARRAAARIGTEGNKKVLKNNIKPSSGLKLFDRFFRKNKSTYQSKVRAIKEQQQPSQADKRRLLSRFRNSFVNLATPMIAHSEPASVETFSVRMADGGEKEFSVWDHVQIPVSASALTMQGLETALRATFEFYQLQSVCLGDALLYADYLVSDPQRGAAQRQLSIVELLVRHTVEAAIDGDDEDERLEQRHQHTEHSGACHLCESRLSESDLQLAQDYAELVTGGSEDQDVLEKIIGKFHAISKSVNDLVGGAEFLDLNVVCTSRQRASDDIIETDFKLPLVRVKIL